MGVISWKLSFHVDFITPVFSLHEVPLAEDDRNNGVNPKVKKPNYESTADGCIQYVT